MLTLLYHNLLTSCADGLPVAGHQTTLASFRAHIRRLRDKLLHPLEVHEQLLRGKKPSGVLITFDDGAGGVIEAGRELAEIGAVGVAFVCPGSITSGLWFYTLADALVRTSVTDLKWRDCEMYLGTPILRRNAYRLLSEKLFDMTPADRDICLKEIQSVLSPRSGQMNAGLEVLDFAGVRTAVETGGLILGNHSWSHPNLTTLGDTELREELDASQKWFDASGLPVLPWFAFPRGRHDQRVRSEVAKRYPIAFGATPDDTDVLPRTGIYGPDSNRLRFAMKTAIEGRVRRWLRR